MWGALAGTATAKSPGVTDAINYAKDETKKALGDYYYTDHARVRPVGSQVKIVPPR